MSKWSSSRDKKCHTGKACATSPACVAKIERCAWWKRSLKGSRNSLTSEALCVLGPTSLCWFESCCQTSRCSYSATRDDDQSRSQWKMKNRALRWTSHQMSSAKSNRKASIIRCSKSFLASRSNRNWTECSLMEYLARIWTKRSMTVMLLAKLDGDSCNSRSSTRSQGLTSYKPLGITLLMTLWPSRESLMCQTIKSKQTPWTCQVLLSSLRDSSTTESMTSKCSTTWGTRTIPWL